MFLLTYTVFINLLPFAYYNAMDDPKPSERLPPLKRQNALWGVKLLEALNLKGNFDRVIITYNSGGLGLPHKQ